MPQIIVDGKDAALIKEAARTVRVVDHSGNVVGYITPAGIDAELVKWKQRLLVDEPTYTTAEVMSHLRSLEAQ